MIEYLGSWQLVQFILKWVSTVFAPHHLNAITNPNPNLNPNADPDPNPMCGSVHKVWCKNRGKPRNRHSLHYLLSTTQ